MQLLKRLHKLDTIKKLVPSGILMFKQKFVVKIVCALTGLGLWEDPVRATHRDITAMTTQDRFSLAYTPDILTWARDHGPN